MCEIFLGLWILRWPQWIRRPDTMQ